MIKGLGSQEENHELDFPVGKITLSCYQCDREVDWLAPDSRCSECTKYTPEELKGET